MNKSEDSNQGEASPNTDPVSDGANPHQASPSARSSTWRERSTLQERFALALQAVPRPIQMLVSTASTLWKMEPAVLLLAALHQLAAATGRLHRIRHIYLGFSCPFSVVFCAEQKSRCRFLEFLGEPWLQHVRINLREHQALGAQGIRDEMEERIRRFKEAPRTPGFDYRKFEDERDGRKAVWYPNLVTSTASPDRMMRAVNSSYDRLVMALDGSMDPFEELLGRHRSQTERLCRLLILGWEDIDLPDKGSIPTRGMVHLCWRTHKSAARRMVLDRRSPWRLMAPPVLLIRQHSAPSFLEELPADIFEMWSGMLVACHMRRHSSRNITTWKLSDDAKRLWAAFHEELLGDTSVFAPFPSEWFRWLPELTVRLALLLCVLRSFTEKEPPEIWTVDAEALERACVITRWLAHEHLETLHGLLKAESVGVCPENDTFDGIDTIDDQAVEAAIVARLRDKGPMSYRELMRSFHKMTRATLERIVSSMIRAGIITKTPYETLKISQ
jgi:hypothetical protein